MTGPEQHADTVREALHLLRAYTFGEDVDLAAAHEGELNAHSALDALVALAERADTLERERDEAMGQSERAIELLEAATVGWRAEMDAKEQARAEADRLREALRQIAGYEHPLGMSTRDSFDRAQEIARAALAGPQTKEQT